MVPDLHLEVDALICPPDLDQEPLPRDALAVLGPLI
jgi:hypothetical protein